MSINWSLPQGQQTPCYQPKPLTLARKGVPHEFATPKRHSFLRLVLALLVFAIALSLLIKAASNSAIAHAPETAAVAQDNEKSLGIERYANEPFELVDLKIGEKSVKNNIKPKIKDSHNRAVLDDVRFKGADDWFKTVAVRLRNVSARPIRGVKGGLYFRPGEARMMFEMALKLTEARNLFQQPLQPGDEIDLNINEASFNQGMRYMIQYGVDATQCSVILSVDTAWFSDDLGWMKGAFIRRDSNNPKNWSAVETAEPSPASPESSLARFEKSLDIERHANEPLELVDLKISNRSVKNEIKVKFRRGDDGFDSVRFNDADDWAKRLQVRLRNVSGKTIVGFQAYLYLKPAGSQVLFSVSLTGPQHLEETSLAPGDEIQAELDSGSWERAITRFTAHGGELNSAEMSLSVGIVGFSDGLQWHKGHTLRIDPDNPSHQIPVDVKRP